MWIVNRLILIRNCKFILVFLILLYGCVDKSIPIIIYNNKHKVKKSNDFYIERHDTTSLDMSDIWVVSQMKDSTKHGICYIFYCSKVKDTLNDEVFRLVAKGKHKNGKRNGLWKFYFNGKSTIKDWRFYSKYLKINVKSSEANYRFK